MEILHKGGYRIVNYNPRRTVCPWVPKRDTFYVTDSSHQIFNAIQGESNNSTKKNFIIENPEYANFNRICILWIFLNGMYTSTHLPSFCLMFLSSCQNLFVLLPLTLKSLQKMAILMWDSWPQKLKQKRSTTV